MAKRFFFSPVIGTGTHADPYRLKCHGLPGVGFAAINPIGADGKPVFGWGMALVSGADLSAADADPDMFGVPEVTPDTQLSAFPVNVRNRALNWLSGRGVNVTGITTSSTVADLLDRARAVLGDDWRSLFVL